MLDVLDFPVDELQKLPVTHSSCSVLLCQLQPILKTLAFIAVRSLRIWCHRGSRHFKSVISFAAFQGSQGFRKDWEGTNFNLPKIFFGSQPEIIQVRYKLYDKLGNRIVFGACLVKGWKPQLPSLMTEGLWVAACELSSRRSPGNSSHSPWCLLNYQSVV